MSFCCHNSFALCRFLLPPPGQAISITKSTILGAARTIAATTFATMLPQFLLLSAPRPNTCRSYCFHNSYCCHSHSYVATTTTSTTIRAFAPILSSHPTSTTSMTTIGAWCHYCCHRFCTALQLSCCQWYPELLLPHQLLLQTATVILLSNKLFCCHCSSCSTAFAFDAPCCGHHQPKPDHNYHQHVD